jgi:predicted P-loop ATPase
VDVLSACKKVFFVANAMIRKALLLYGEVRLDAMGEAAFDVLNCSFERRVFRREQKMHVVRHDDEVMQQVVAFTAVVLQHFEEEFGAFGSQKDVAKLVAVVIKNVPGREVLRGIALRAFVRALSAP